MQELIHLLDEMPEAGYGDLGCLRDRLWTISSLSRDRSGWKLTGNGLFTVKSFYNFLNDGGLR